MSTRDQPVARRLPRLAVTAEPVLSWLAARAVVLGTLALAAFVADSALSAHLHRQGLLGWDAAYYRDIAAQGYAGLPREALRFYPLVPLLVRLLGLGHGAGPVLLVVVQLAALGYAVLLARLVRTEGWGAATASRAVWLLALAPPAFVLVMGYAEAVAGLLAVGAFLGLRTRRWWLAAACGLLAGLTRPSGLLLVAPALIEALRQPREQPAGRAAAVGAPLVGSSLYLGWASVHDGQLLAPLRIQQSAALHGSTTNPVHVLADAVSGLAHGHVGTGLHVPWLVVFVVLLVLMARTLPASYTLWCTLTVASALAGSNLDSLERYCWSAFPFVVVAARLTGHQVVFRTVLALCAGLLAGYAMLAFLGLAVP